MSFETIQGQPLAVKLLESWLAKKTNHPLLFFGPPSAGKRTMATQVASALNCLETPGVKACGRCHSCKRIAANKHPDVCVVDLAYQAAVRGEPLEKQQFLRIETLLEERKRLYQTAVEARWKVSILDEAHRMTPDAANVLLKVLEEPPERTAIFLVTPYRDRILATLQSRCQPVRFRSVQVPAAFASKETELLWKDLPRRTPRQILSGQAPRATRSEIETQIEQLLAPALRDFRSGVPRSAQKVELLQRAQQQLRQNVPPALVYDHLLLNLARSR